MTPAASAGIELIMQLMALGVIIGVLLIFLSITRP